MTQTKVCSLDLVPAGSMKQFYVSDLEVVIINLGGQIYC
jgi:nitrite reductase/ring-hydroxylating ferredoxin subunit